MILNQRISNSCKTIFFCACCRYRNWPVDPQYVGVTQYPFPPYCAICELGFRLVEDWIRLDCAKRHLQRWVLLNTKRNQDCTNHILSYLTGNPRDSTKPFLATGDRRSEQRAIRVAYNYIRNTIYDTFSPGNQILTQWVSDIRDNCIQPYQDPTPTFLPGAQASVVIDESAVHFRDEAFINHPIIQVVDPNPPPRYEEFIPLQWALRSENLVYHQHPQQTNLDLILTKQTTNQDKCPKVR